MPTLSMFQRFRKFVCVGEMAALLFGKTDKSQQTKLAVKNPTICGNSRNLRCRVSNTVHSKLRRRNLFVLGYRFQQTGFWCGREDQAPQCFACIPPNAASRNRVKQGPLCTQLCTHRHGPPHPPGIVKYKPHPRFS